MNALQVLGGNLHGLWGSDVQHHGAALQFGHDPHRDPQFVQALAARNRAEAEYARAHAASLQPEHQLALIQHINGDPNLRAMYLASKGVDADTISQLPTQPAQAGPGEASINPANLGQHLANPQNASMKALLENPDLSLLDRTRQAALFPGFRDFNNPNRQMYDAWLKTQYTDPNKWLQDTAVPEDPEQAVPFLGRIPGISASAIGSMLGQETGTGLYWRQNHQNARALNDLLQQYNISPFAG
jgi:hypothetical protein